MPLRSSLKIHGVNGDADAFEVSFALDDVEAQMAPSGATQKLSFDKTSAAVSSDIVSSELASNEIVSSDIVSSDIASSAALSDRSAAAAAVPVPASSPLHYFI